MGQASMRKWMKRARETAGCGIPSPERIYDTALHMRLRERKRRGFWRGYLSVSEYAATLDDALLDPRRAAAVGVEVRRG